MRPATVLSSPPASPPGITPAFVAQRDALLCRLPLRHVGDCQVRIGFECQGPAGAPVLLVAGGISAHRHVAACGEFPEPGWWPAQVGPGLALDTERWRILAMDWLGADGGLARAPDSADQADAVAALLDHLGIPGLAAVVGCSYGAMVGLQFAARHRQRLGRLVAISGGDRPHPFASAWRSLQRRILELGNSESSRRRALSLARQLAMLSYRTPEEFAERFDAPARFEGDAVRSAADDYLRACGDRYVARTPADAFLRLSESLDLHRVDPAAVTTPTTLVAIEEDRLVPADTLADLARRLSGPCHFERLRSRAGHDAFLVEHEAIAGVLARALAGATA